MIKLFRRRRAEVADPEVVEQLVKAAGERLDWDVDEIAFYPLNRDVLRVMAEAIVTEYRREDE